MLESIRFVDEIPVLELNGAELSDAYAYLKSIDCETPEDLEKEGDMVMLDTNACWKYGRHPFYENIEELWASLRPLSKEPERYYIPDLDCQVMSSVVKKVKYYFSLRSVLEGLAHHEKSMKYVFFTSKESHLVKLEISYALSFSEFEKISVEPLVSEKIEFLKNSVLMPDVHSAERRHVMREALVEFFKSYDVKSISSLISGIENFYAAYEDRYKVYVSQFSVNKILSEIESERLNFICKIQDAVISQQAKAFAVPGAVVAIGAVLRFANNLWDYFIIFIGLFLTVWMITAINNNVRGQISLLGNEFFHSFEKYSDIRSGIESVETEIKKSKDALQDIIDKSKNKLEDLTWFSWYILIFVTLLMVSKAN